MPLVHCLCQSASTGLYWLQARTAARFGVVVGEVKVDFKQIMRLMRELRAKLSVNDSAKRFATMGVDVYQVQHAWLDLQCHATGGPSCP